MWPSQEIMAVAKNRITMVKEIMEKDRVAATTHGCYLEPECLPQNMLLLGQQALDPHHLGSRCVLQPLDNVGYWDQQQILISHPCSSTPSSSHSPLGTYLWPQRTFAPGSSVLLSPAML